MAEALSGTPPDFPLFHGTIAEFVLSDPFEENSRWIKEGPECNKGHFLKGKTPAQKPILINSQTGAQISSSRLRQDVARLAAGLRNKLNLHPAPYVKGPRTQAIVSPVVLIHLPNCIPFAIIELAVWQAGLTATTANSALKPAELAHIINLSKPAAVFTLAGKDGVDILREALTHVENQEVVKSYKTKNRIFSVDLAADDYGLCLNHQHGATSDWKTLLDGEDDKLGFPQYQQDSDENDRRAAVILWSSGTSGKSKGVILGHRAILVSVQSLFYGNPLFGPNEVFIGFAPFFHVFGLCNVYLLGIAMGATTVCMSKFEPRAFLQLAQDYRATHLHMAPPVAVILAKSPMLDGYDVSSVLGGTSGGAPLGVSILEDVYKRLGFLIKMGYGLSETASTSLVPGNTWEEYSEYINASGKPLPSVELKIIDVGGEGKTLKIGEAGEILIRSPSLMNGYLENPQATKEALDDDGWFHTGDVGKLDAGGNLYIVDRLKEVIKVKGFQVAPAELEAYLNAHPAVADAGVTAIYSEDDATEYPKAYIVPKDTALLESSAKAGQACPQTVAFVKDVLKHIEGKVIDYKWIRGGVVVCEAIPKSNSGKILRKDFKTVSGHFVQIYEAKKRAVRQSKL